MRTNRFLARKLLVALNLIVWMGAEEMLAQSYSDHPLVHTYSIVAYDSITGNMGVAVQSHWFSVGPLVAWGEAGVGVVATQSFVNPAYGPNGLALLKAGLSPREALDSLLGSDPGKAVRQVGILDNKGRSAAHTGEKCIQAAGHIVGPNYAVQANLMLNDQVWPAMAEAFENSRGPLAERMVKALQAAQQKGGDLRGKQSAALLVVKARSTGQIWRDRLVDLRVEDHPDPVQELARLLRVHRAYEFMNKGDVAMEMGKAEEALKQYGTAEAMFPQNLEMKFWHAINLANLGDLETALPLFEQVFASDNHWEMLIPRLIEVDLLTVSEQDLDRILGQ